MTSSERAAFRAALSNKFDYSALMECAWLLSQSYEFFQFSYLTESVMGRGIPMFRMGEGSKEFYYIGAHHGAEGITGALLLRFIGEFAELASRHATLMGVNLDYILRSRSLYFIPVLNVDGVDIAVNGVSKDNLIYTRLVGMNGSEDFTGWQANARGVDLNHNYDSGFSAYKEIEKSLGITGGANTRYSGERPESEPETGALCNYLRFNHPTAVLSLHTQGREIYYTSGGKGLPSSHAVARRLASFCGYKLAEPSGSAAYGGLTDFCIEKLQVPAFTFECGRGKNPLPASALPELYAEMRKVLFLFPTLF